MAVGISYNSQKASRVRLMPNEKVSYSKTERQTGEGIKRLYHADNLDVLHSLMRDKDVFGKVTLIYIDPPYNTGGSFETV